MGTIIVLNVAQIVLIVWHTAQNNHLTNLKNRLTIAHQKYKPYEEDWEKISNVIGKISKYKQVSEQSNNVTDYMNVFISKIPQDIQLEELSYSNKQVLIKFESPSVLAFTRVVNNFFGENLVQRIELKAASLNASKETFSIEAGVVFK